MWVIILLLLTFIAPGLALILTQRKTGRFKNLPVLGLVIGLLPVLASVLWSVFFILKYKSAYDSEHDFDRIVWLKLTHYALLPILMPLFPRFIWKKVRQPLFWKRVLLLVGFVLGAIAGENIPVGWTFTFMLFPVSILVMIVTICLCR